MTRQTNVSVTERAYRLYDEKLKAILEPEHRGEFLAIEPDWRRYFLDKELIRVCEQAWEAFPNQVTQLMRIGFPSVMEIGYAQSFETN